MESLVLNKGAVPVAVVPWKRAVVLVQSGKAITLENYRDTIIRSSGYIAMRTVVTRSHNHAVSMMIPSVVQCIHSGFTPRKYTSILPFNRRNVYIRDKGCCMYCGKKVSISNFSFDHVIPRCEGGTTSWENIVVSCIRCNGEKGSKRASRFKRRLIRRPFAPRLDKAAPSHLVNKIAGEIPHETWNDYIYWNLILEP